MNVRTLVRNHPYLSALIWIITILAVMIFMTACASTTVAPPSLAEEVDAPSAEPVAEPEPSAVVEDYIVSFGEVFTWEDGISISVSEPTAFVPTNTAAGVTPGATNLVFAITLTNNSGAVYEPYAFGSVSSGGSESSAVFDMGNPIGEIGWDPTTSMLDGDSITWLEAYSVMDANAILFEVSPGFQYENAIFTNR